MTTADGARHRTRRSLSDVWPLALILWAVLAVLAELVEIGHVIQPVLVFSFALVCPGAAALRLVRVGDQLARLVLTIAISTALSTTLAQLLLALGWWSPTGWIVILALLTLAFVALSRARGRSSHPTSEDHPREQRLTQES